MKIAAIVPVKRARSTIKIALYGLYSISWISIAIVAPKETTPKIREKAKETNIIALSIKILSII